MTRISPSAISRSPVRTQRPAPAAVKSAVIARRFPEGEARAARADELEDADLAGEADRRRAARRVLLGGELGRALTPAAIETFSSSKTSRPLWISVWRARNGGLKKGSSRILCDEAGDQRIDPCVVREEDAGRLGHRFGGRGGNARRRPGRNGGGPGHGPNRARRHRWPPGLALPRTVRRARF